MDDETTVFKFDLRDTFPDYGQFSAFGGPADDPERSGTAKTIKPLLDATHESIALIVTSIGSINTILTGLAAFIPSPMSVDAEPSELERLNESVKRLNEAFAKINPSKEEEQ